MGRKLDQQTEKDRNCIDFLGMLFDNYLFILDRTINIQIEECDNIDFYFSEIKLESKQIDSI